MDIPEPSRPSTGAISLPKSLAHNNLFFLSFCWNLSGKNLSYVTKYPVDAQPSFWLLFWQPRDRRRPIQYTKADAHS
ncbi:MAG: hypothetical protein DMF22_03435 [Verrucomicrobia bacterium]|nr:MAG: hypothetical protein DMF22_03435 [Verrucomicrobiota bacterium]